MMPPKATEKKLVAKKAAAFVQKDIDSTKYVRKQEILEPINPVTVPQLTGFIALIDKIFPEWSNTNQNWHDVQDTEEYANYPKELTHHSIQSIRTLLNLDTSESKAKSKGDTKRGKEASFEVISEAHTDEEGRHLPRIVFCDDGSLNDYSRPLLFMRTYSGEQIERMSAQKISTCDATSIGISKYIVEGSSRNIPRKGDNEVEEPTGSEIDPSMCAVFRIIAEFARNCNYCTVESNSSDRRDSPSRFLWNSIYPQLASGRPVYNPTGRYTVRLFLGGKWRKVQVTDIIPIGPHGCAIARSKESHELWPVILSKAVYSVYTACGYHNSLPTLHRSSSEKHYKKQSMTSSLSSTHKTSFFIGFAVHALTGWQPTTPRSVKDTVNIDIQGVRSMLKDLLAGGAQIITDREVPRLKPSTLRQSSLEIFQDLNEYQTKNYFREEYNMRLAERAQVIEENQIREDLVENLDKILSAPMSEGFVLCTHDEALANVLTVPVLGLCLSTTGCVGGPGTSRLLSSSELIQFIEDKGKEQSDYAILNKIKLLVNWRTSPPISSHSSSSSIPSQANVNSTDAAGMLKELNKPLPSTSSIDYRWITLKELSANEAFLIGIDVLAQKRYEAQYHWPWVPLGGEKEKEKGDKGVDRGARSSIKGKAADSMKGSSVLCGDQGTCPPLLLTLDTTDYFNSNSGNEHSDAPPEGLPTSCPALHGKKSMKTCISLSLLVYTDIIVPPDSAGSDIITKTPLSVVNKDKVPASGTLNVPIKIDLGVKVPHMNISDDRSFYNQGGQCGDYEVEGGGGGGCEIDMMPSGVTVILQEIRTDGAEPYVMRAELSSAARIPLTRTTFHIPSERIHKSTGHMVFWVRLFSKASVHMIVSSLAPVVLGEAEEVWSGMGGCVLVREGEAAPTRHRTEQMLFRVPLQLEVPEKSCEDETVKNGNKESVALSLLNYSPHASCNRDKDSQAKHQVTAFLHISCREVARSVSLILSSGEAVSLPRIDGNCFLLSSRGKTVMTGRCYVSDKAYRALPAFKWKLTIISSVALSESTASTSTSIVKTLQQRYRSYYRPNNRLMIFKDIYSIDSATFPVALRISLDSLTASSVCPLDILEGQGQGQGQGLMEGQGKDTSIDMEDINFIVRLYRGTDRTLIAESRGRGVLQLYHISLESLLSTTLPEQVNAPNLDTLGKGRKVSAKRTCDLKGTGLGRKTPQGDEVELLVECTVDESATLVPPLWRSRIPFNFNIDSADSSMGTGQGQMVGQNTYRSKSRDSCDLKVSCTPTSLLSSLNPATALPQFRWQIDVLAGSVLSVSHDTYALEAQMSLKNTWEEGSHGRALRATAAMAFAVERKAFKATHLLSLHSTSDENITTETGICTTVAGLSGDVPEKLIDLLTLALEKEDRTSVTEREARLLDLVEYKEHIEDWRSTAPHTIEPGAAEMQKLERAQRKESTEVESRRINAAVLELNETIQNRASMRIQSITAQAVAAAACIASHWEFREVHRLDCLIKVQAHRMQTDLHAADCAALAAANELALLGEAKDRKPQRGRGVQ